MPLSRLENFLKNVTGNVIYVNPEELDATDDISNTGNSRTRPFKTIQRALIEAARFSYQIGSNNDRFDKTTIMVSPGTHYIDNRPGLKIDTSGSLTDVNGTAATIDQFGVGTNFDIQDPNNVLHKFNSIHGGVVLPRGTSIVGQDLRKTKIKPKFVPQPDNDNIDTSAIFRVTGGCFFFGFSFFDGDPNDRVFRDYTSNVYAPNYSHHKLWCFEYADGVNPVDGQGGNTDLDMYYQKLTLAYGTNSGRALPNYPSNDDFQATVDESRIVGAISQIGDITISDIYSGSNPTDSVATPVVTVVTATDHSFNVGTPVLITGIDDANYDGSYIVTQVLSDTSFTYSVPTTPTSTATPNLSGKTPAVKIESDTVGSASPYIFNCSIRSVYGINGMNADGHKATGFKSMVVAQFTGIALNKDDNAYVKYNTTTGAWEEQSALGSGVSLHTDSLAKHKPGWENCHIRVANNSIIQAVSVFAIGYATHFLAENGGDMSITNSNSNFGAKALQADKYRYEAFLKDDKGYITEIFVPQQNFAKEVNINYLPLDVDITAGLSTDTKIYLYDYLQKDNIPSHTSNGFFFGNKIGETIEVGVGDTTFGATVLMPVPQSNPDERVTGRKEFFVGRTSGISSITGNTFTLQTDHKLLPGEKVRIYSEDGSLPDGLDYNRDYYAITESLNANQIRIATTYNNAISGSEITGINNLGGQLRIVSTVAGKKPGDPGHPVQYDSSGWYVNVGAGNSLHAAIVSQQADITPKTKTSFFKRTYDSRTDLQKRYGLKYVIPQSVTYASAPTSGFSILPSSSLPDDTNYQNDNNTLTSETDLRTKTNIINASWSGNVGVITCEYPHGLKSGHIVEINRLKSANNVGGTDDSGFNGTFEVSGITDATTFSVGLNTNPGGITTITSGTPYTFHDRTVVGSGRTFSPYFVKRDFAPLSYQIQDSDEIQEYKSGVQDGIYDLTLRGYISQPTVSPFSTAANYFGQDIIDIVPFEDYDNPVNDPQAAVSYAVRDEIGNVETNDPSRSITREGLDSFLEEAGIVTPISTTSHTSGAFTIICDREHGFGGVTGIQSITGGTNLGSGSGSAEFYYNVRLSGGTGEGATADVTVAAAGTITAVDLNHPGSGYSVNDTLTIEGVPRSAAGSDCTVGVANIFNPVGDAVQIVGVGSTAYNGTRRIESVTNSTTFTVSGSANAGSTGGYVYHVGVTTAVTNISYDKTSGIGTVQLEGDIGLRRGDCIVIDGSDAFYNGKHFITDRVGYGSSLSVDFGKNSTVPTFTASGVTAHGTGIEIRGNGRGVPIYGGHTTRLTSGITTTSTSINLADNGTLRRGDFLLIEDEIVMISNKNVSTMIRGVMGTNATNHDENVAVRRIKVVPTENRRYSVLRASGHTFEYVGFGPGNYSTAMPQSQDRVRSEREELVAQSLTSRGGFIVYTGMNDQGDFYIGNLKVDAASGSLTFVGGISGRSRDTRVGATVLPQSAVFNDVTVNASLQSNGDTEIIDLLLKGDRSGDIGKSVYVGIKDGDTTPTSNIDNILLRTSYVVGGYLGWVRSSGGDWKRFGPISKAGDSEHYEVDRLEVTGITTMSDTLNIGGDIRQSSGNAQIAGVCTATTFVGNGITPIGGIIMWSGSVASIPGGWALCNGANGTPNLTDKFVIGAGGSYNPDATGGSADAVVVAHSHTITQTDHSHTYSQSRDGNNFGGDGQDVHQNFTTQSTGGAQANITIDSEGVSGTGKNLPPYYALAYIMRIA